MTKKCTSRSAVFIDVDLTLLNCESFRLFSLRRYFGPDFQKILSVLYAYLLRRILLISVSQFKERCLLNLKGIKHSEIELLGKEFCKMVLLKKIRPGGKLCVQHHKCQGRPIYLVSASPNFYISSLTNHLQLAGNISTELNFSVDGTFTGKFEGNECIGEEKAKRVLEFARKESFDLRSSFFYSDCYEDLPLLASVGIPVGVWPDTRLKKACIKKGWAVEYW